MEPVILPFDPEAVRFKSISEFKQSMNWGTEVVFEWKGKEYGAFSPIKDPRDGVFKMLIFEKGDLCGETEKWCENADEVLEYMVGEDRLRDVITQVSVIDRTL